MNLLSVKRLEKEVLFINALILMSLKGYGRVFLGKFSGIEVAIKEYGKTKLDVRRAEDFVKEVEVISNLRHPNIVLCMGACIHNGKYLMITE